MDNIFLSFSLAFLVTFFAIPVIIQVTKEKKMFDEPDERKVHKGVIPTLGGLGIFGGFILATLLGVPVGGAHYLQYFVASLMVIFFLGIKDDILIISATKKFIGQLIAAGILIKFGNIQIDNMHGLFGLEKIPNTASITLTMFTIIVITNSFNLIDGVDGLAGSLGLLTALVFGIYFLLINQIMFSVMAFSLAGSLVGFLIYNFSPAKIFMGDTGSLIIGLLNSIFVIKFISIAADPLIKYPLQATPALGFAVLIVPLFDTLRVFGLRILNRRSPFSADRNHVHHFLLDIGLSHKMITLTCVSVNILFILTAYFLQAIGTTWVMLILSSLAVLFIGIIYYSRPKRASATIHSISEKTIITPSKIFSLTADRIEHN